MRIAVLVFALLFACAQGGDESDKTQAGPKATLEHWASAWRAGDVKKMLTFYGDSKDVFPIASSGRRYEGAAGVRTMYEEAFGEADWNNVQLRDVKVVRHGDVAWTSCRFQAEMTLKPDGVTLVFTSQGTVVLQRMENGWRIVLEHFSPIADVPRIQRKE